ncbi:MAG: response regulator [Gammaproteobacteria bacterium]
MPVLNRIMMVDDEPDIRTVACLALEALGGFTVQLCGSGSEAATMASIFNPDLILLDVMMPGMDGPGTLKTLRDKAETAAIPVIFMTAKAQAQEVDHYKKLGALDVIAKPFDPMTLAATVKQIWLKSYG